MFGRKNYEDTNEARFMRSLKLPVGRDLWSEDGYVARGYCWLAIIGVAFAIYAFAVELGRFYFLGR